jgi:hypothetical protein
MPGVLRHYAAWLLAGIGAAGCTSILGDFTTSPAGTNGTDAGNTDASTDGAVVTDGAANDSGATDGSDDAAALTLKCDSWRFPQPIVVDSLKGQRTTYSDRAFVASASQDIVKIVALANQSPGATFYTVEKRDSAANITSFQLAGAQPRQLHHAVDASRVLAITTTSSPTGPIVRELAVFTIPDSAPQGPASAIDMLTKGTVFSDNVRAQAIDLAPINGWFFGMSQALNPQDPSSNVELGVGRYIPKGDLRAYGQINKNAPKTEQLVILRNASDVYLFTGSSSGGQAGTVAYKVPDTAVVPPGTTPRPVSTGKPAIIFDAVPHGLAKFNLAFLELDTASATEIATLRVGQIDGSSLDTFLAGDLPKARGFADVGEIPVDKGSAEWDGDDFYAVGRVLASQSQSGVNFLWTDAAGHVRGERIGANALLTERSGVSRVSASVAQRIALKYVTFNIVWTETAKDSAGGFEFDTLYLNELVCH